MDYTEIKYVDINIGIDDETSGSEIQPYQTIEYCVSQLTTSNPLVYIGDGIYTISYLTKLSKYESQITYKGNNNTIIEVANGGSSAHNWANECNIYNCTIRPVSDCLLNYISNTNDGRAVNYYNCLFTKSTDGINPKYAMLRASNKYFYNCTFAGNIETCDDGRVRLYNCALEYNLTSNSVILYDSILGCAFDNDYFIVGDDNIVLNMNNIYGVYSGDNQWSAILLKMNGLYYSVDNSLYNTESGQYNPLPNADFNYRFPINSLFKDVTIGLETFKPIDKFNNFFIVMPLKLANYTFLINAIKSKKELVVQSFDINTSLIGNINSLIATTNIPETSNIKFVFSSDMGDTWMTIVDGIPEYTDCVIPKKRSQDFTNEDELHFNAAKGTIDEVGFSVDILSSFDWNSLNLEKLRFAYVFSTDKYINNPSMQRLSINYDEKGFMQEMKDTECDIEVFDHTVKVKSNISNPLIETDIII